MYIGAAPVPPPRPYRTGLSNEERPLPRLPEETTDYIERPTSDSDSDYESDIKVVQSFRRSNNKADTDQVGATDNSLDDSCLFDMAGGAQYAPPHMTNSPLEAEVPCGECNSVLDFMVKCKVHCTHLFDDY